MPSHDNGSFGGVHVRPSVRLARRVKPSDGDVIDWAFEQEKERSRLRLLSERRGLSGTLARLSDAGANWTVTIATGELPVCV